MEAGPGSRQVRVWLVATPTFGATVWLIASLAAFAALGALSWSTWPAAAAQSTGVEIVAESGVGGLHRRGYATMIRVRVTTDRLVAGTIRITQPLAATAAYEVDAELAGGSTKEFLIPVPLVGLGTIQVELVEDGQVTGQRQLSVLDARGEELVGVMPGLAESRPGSLELMIDVQDARLESIDDRWIELGASAIEALDKIVVTGGDLEALGPDASVNLARWVSGGGMLVVDEVAGSPLAGLNVVTSERPVRFGSGSVVSTGGQLGAGNWDGLLPPSSIPAGQEWFFGEPLEFELMQESGFRFPSVPGVVAVLGAYVLIAGPLLWIGLSRAKRPGALWFAVPALAAIFTGGIWFAGSALRADLRNTHGAVIIVDDGNATVDDTVLMSSRRGGEVTVELEGSWTADPSSSSQRFGFGLTPAQTIRFGNARTEVSQSVDAGGFVAFSASRPAPEFDSAIEVEAVTNPAGQVELSIRNNLAVALHDLGVVSGAVGELIGDLEAGQLITKQFEPHVIQQWDQPVVYSLWLNRFDVAPEPADLASPGLLDVHSQRAGWPNSGTVAVLGWTDALPSPIDPSITVGPTLVSALSPITADIENLQSAARLDPTALPVTLLRSPHQLVDGEDFGPNSFTARSLVQLDLPAGVQPGNVAIELPVDTVDAAIWNPTAAKWIRHKPIGGGQFTIEPDAFVNGALYIKIGSSRFDGMAQVSSGLRFIVGYNSGLISGHLGAPVPEPS